MNDRNNRRSARVLASEAEGEGRVRPTDAARILAADAGLTASDLDFAAPTGPRRADPPAGQNSFTVHLWRKRHSLS